MTNDEIFQSLLDFYQTKGLDPGLVLRDPVFVRMPTEDKLNLVKKYGRTLAQGIPQGASSNDLKIMGKDSALGAAVGAGIGLQAILAYAGMTGSSPKAHLPLIPIIALGGAGLGAISSGNRYLDRLSQRREMRQELEHSSSSEKPAAGVGALTTAHIHSVAPQGRLQSFLSQFGFGHSDYSRLRDVAEGHFSQFHPGP